MTDEQLLQKVETQFAEERSLSHSILLNLLEIRKRRLYAKRGFSSLFEMLMKHFHQSETAANQRLRALELMTEVPVVEERLVSGELNMSTLALAQRQIKREEKITGKRVSREKKERIVEAITNKTLGESERVLFELLPDAARAPQNSERRISSGATRMNLTMPDDVCAMIERLKEIWSHVEPDTVEVIRRALKITLEKLEKKTQSATESVKHRSSERLKYYGKGYDQALWERAGSRCEFIDETTGRRCECTKKLQREHVIPLAMGGTNELSNMQLLCKTHNLLRTRTVFGDETINRYQRRNST